jgi:hypothetical protein
VVTGGRVRRACGHVLLLGGVLAFLGIAAAAVLGVRPFAPVWAFLACATAMAGAALRQPAGDPAGEGRAEDSPLAMAPAEGGGTGAGDPATLGGEADAGDGDGSE